MDRRELSLAVGMAFLVSSVAWADNEETHQRAEAYARQRERFTERELQALEMLPADQRDMEYEQQLKTQLDTLQVKQAERAIKRKKRDEGSAPNGR